MASNGLALLGLKVNRLEKEIVAMFISNFITLATYGYFTTSMFEFKYI